MNPSQTSLATSLDLPGYLVGGAMLLLVMVFHGVMLLQIAKRYEVKTFLYLAEKKFTAVALCFYISVFLLFLTHTQSSYLHQIRALGFSSEEIKEALK